MPHHIMHDRVFWGLVMEGRFRGEGLDTSTRDVSSSGNHLPFLMPGWMVVQWCLHCCRDRPGMPLLIACNTSGCVSIWTCVCEIEKGGGGGGGLMERFVVAKAVTPPTSKCCHSNNFPGLHQGICCIVRTGGKPQCPCWSRLLPQGGGGGGGGLMGSDPPLALILAQHACSHTGIF